MTAPEPWVPPSLDEIPPEEIERPYQKINWRLTAKIAWFAGSSGLIAYGCYRPGNTIVLGMDGYFIPIFLWLSPKENDAGLAQTRPRVLPPLSLRV
jgi:hypothetical protein